MPTKKKRVGFIPREDVMRIIERLSIENNLSISKIICILVEEALSIRGLFNRKNGKITELYQLNNDDSLNSPDISADFFDNDKPPFDTKLGNQNNRSKSPFINGLNHEEFDFRTYKKFLLFLKFQEMLDKYNT